MPTDIEWELRARDHFVERQLGRQPAGLEAMDLTRFMHGGAGEIVTCTICGTLSRQTGHAARYESDRYDATLLRHLYPRYREAFEQKRPQYEPLLRAHAEVVEIGSHIGAFLEAAETWGWRPIGLDIGAETTAFASRQGATAKRFALPDYSPRRRLDAIFIWNCFEQLADPRQSLVDAHRILTRHGLVVLRVPNGGYYREHITRARAWLPFLGFNNLLGFPYLHGYNSNGLRQLLQSTAFELVATFPASLLTPPYPEMSTSLRNEWRIVQTKSDHNEVNQSPWIEVVARRADHNVVAS